VLMKRARVCFNCFVLVLLCALASGTARAQQQRGGDGADSEFGPVVRAYLGYLKDEQEVVDDRVSRREISPAYYRRNSNRIRALRQVAIRIARETENDYLPELEAATNDEMKNLFEQPPRPAALRVGEVVEDKFRYLGTVRSGEIFYIFARLDPYEQAELMKKEKPQQDNKAAQPAATAPTTAPTASAGDGTRPRRTNSAP
jgi:hypothetical protein